MEYLWGLLIVVALAAIVRGVFVGLFRKGRRKSGWLSALVSVVVFVASLVLWGMAMDSSAIAEGYLSHSDRIAASKAGAKDAVEWAKLRDLSDRQRAEVATEQQRVKLIAQQEAEEKKKRDAEIWAARKEEQAKIEVTKKRDQENSCRTDLKCLGEKDTARIAVVCAKLIEKFAKFDFEWTDGFLEQKFSRYKWKSRDKGVITHIGDKIKFQNGFGAFSNMIYECDFDHMNGLVVDVRVMQGRI